MAGKVLFQTWIYCLLGQVQWMAKCRLEKKKDSSKQPERKINDAAKKSRMPAVMRNSSIVSYRKTRLCTALVLALALKMRVDQQVDTRYSDRPYTDKNSTCVLSKKTVEKCF